jgi:hypothetical protein
MTNDAGDNETYHGYSVDDETQPQDTGDSLADSDRGLADPLDEGYSPPEKWSVGQGYGNTPLEESLGETLDQRLAQEDPEPDPYAPADETGDEDAGDVVDAGEVESGPVRAGRLVAEDEGAHADTEKDLVARDVGIDGADA